MEVIIKLLGASQSHQHRLVGSEWKTSTVTITKHQGLWEEPFQSDDLHASLMGPIPKQRGKDCKKGWAVPLKPGGPEPKSRWEALPLASHLKSSFNLYPLEKTTPLLTVLHLPSWISERGLSKTFLSIHFMHTGGEKKTSQCSCGTRLEQLSVPFGEGEREKKLGDSTH